ncbi:hypothetical protein [Citreicoccus inhibens]|uniref:hypothetical protein n=1 Tax=Citreicoccus inhibens TaxID=2849499 RepID=UPI001F347B9A|nr:hypothetical protein [Citreicoccus inhibens]
MKSTRVSISMFPSTWKEWGLLVLSMLAIVAVFAVVACGDAFRGVVLFWYAWPAFALSAVLHLAHRAVLLWRHRSVAESWVDRILPIAYQVSGLTSFALLFLKL